MLKKTGLIICLCISLGSTAQTPQEIIDSFFKIYAKNEPVKALEDLYSHSPWLKEKNEGVENLKTKFATLQDFVGAYQGHVLLGKKNIENTFIIITYLIKFNGTPITFSFQFYKPEKDWIVYSFSYDDSFVADVEKTFKQELFSEKATK